MKELTYWKNVQSQTVSLIDGDLAPDTGTVDAARTLLLALPAEVTGDLLTAVTTAFHAHINDLLLTALTVALARWTTRNRGRVEGGVLVSLEAHGREDVFVGVDVSNTVGWFASMYPVRIDWTGINLDNAWKGGDGLGRAVKRVKEQLISVPANGIGYGILRYLNRETAKELAGLDTAEILFNYLGRFNTEPRLDGFALEATGGSSEPDTPLTHCLEMNVAIWDLPEGPQLRAEWRWAPKLLSDADVRELADGWIHMLRTLVQRVVEGGIGGRTPADVPLVSLTQEEIELLEREQQKWATHARTLPH
jgi:non-ribosomal peptide synthase protein (TIGR01720 family)